VYITFPFCLTEFSKMFSWSCFLEAKLFPLFFSPFYVTAVVKLIIPLDFRFIRSSSFLPASHAPNPTPFFLLKFPRAFLLEVYPPPLSKLSSSAPPFALFAPNAYGRRCFLIIAEEVWNFLFKYDDVMQPLPPPPEGSLPRPFVLFPRVALWLSLLSSRRNVVEMVLSSPSFDASHPSAG